MYTGYEQRRRRRGKRSGGAAYGLLLEPAATNYWDQNTTLSAWTASGGASIATGQAVGASAYGFSLTSAGGGGAWAYSKIIGALPSGADWCISVLWKAGSNTSMVSEIALNGAGLKILTRIQAAANGSPILSNTAGGYASYPVPGLPGWYRIYGWANNVVPTDSHTLTIRGDNSGIAGTVPFCLPQLEPGYGPTSPIVNAAASTTRARDDFREGDRGALWAAAAGVYVEDSLWLLQNASVSSAFPSTCTPAYPAAASGNDGGLYTVNTDVVQVQNLGSTIISAVTRASQYGTRKIKATRLGGGTAYLHTDGAQTASLADVSAANATNRRAFSSAYYTGQMPVILFRQATYGIDIGAAAVNALTSGAEFPVANLTGLLDHRLKVTPGNFARASTALDDVLAVVASGQPRWARGAI